MDEFESIRRYWLPLGEPPCDGLVRGIGDDCSELSIPSGQNLLQSIDTLVSGTHFPADIHPVDLGWRAMAVSASDLAACGAKPWNVLLALTLPMPDQSWLAGFARGLGESSRLYGLPVVGGDTTRGPLTITLQVQGLCPPGQSLTRSGARPGDLICVSGTLGDAGEALRWLGSPDSSSAAVDAVCQRFLRPTPRLSLGMALRQKATACIDVSDGLLADLGHILAASQVGANLDLAALPLSQPLKTLAGTRALELGLTAGDDYELCFTWPERAGNPDQLCRDGIPISVIGVIESQPGVRFSNPPDDWEAPKNLGYQHFTASSS
ncbi:MAG: thiamine-phosphate kinase [Alteromonadaceae bacterium]|nr:thiamine-phosphate kinase [Alteromonadaceae bacterium]